MTVVKTMMRIGFAAALAIACAPQTTGASPANAKAANTRGVGLLKQKDYKGAIAQFKKAIAEDRAYLLAHYNLACVASLAQDMDTAFAELIWVGNRAGWDEAAKAAAIKAAKDPDLHWVLDTNPDAADWVGPDVALFVVDVLAADKAKTAGHALADAEKATAAALGTGTRTRDDSCDPADAKQGAVLGLPFEAHAGGKHNAVVSLGAGLALLDAKGQVVAHSQPLGCTGPGASQDRMISLAYLSAAPRSEPGASSTTSALLSEIFIVKYGNGGRSQWANNVALFMRRDKQLVKTFEATTERSDASGAGQLSMTALGDLVLVAPGDKRKQVFHWDQKAFKYIAE